MPLRRLFASRTSAPGSRPGTLVAAADAVATTLDIVQYRKDGVLRRGGVTLDDLGDLDEAGTTTWLNVVGLADLDLLRAIGARFGLHRLALEDIVNVPQRPKVDSFGGQLLYVSRMLNYDRAEGLEREQVSVVVIGNVVLTVQERPGDVFDPIRQRIDEGTGPIRESGGAYLFYALIDAVIDGYYPVLERISEHLEAIEDEMMSGPPPDLLRQITAVKADLLAARRSIQPQREALNSLCDPSLELVGESERLYFRDVRDHLVHASDVVESHRELTTTLLNTYLTVVSNKTNEVMKVLTIMASIFIPLTFMAGIYGMNFKYMPELEQRWAYPTLIALMITLTVGMLLWFRRRGWL